MINIDSKVISFSKLKVLKKKNEKHNFLLILCKVTKSNDLKKKIIFFNLALFLYYECYF